MKKEQQKDEVIVEYERRVARVARVLRSMARKCRASNFRVDLRRTEDARLWARSLVENAMNK